jgi:hypothetical protein
MWGKIFLGYFGYFGFFFGFFLDARSNDILRVGCCAVIDLGTYI